MACSRPSRPPSRQTGVDRESPDPITKLFLSTELCRVCGGGYHSPFVHANCCCFGAGILVVAWHGDCRKRRAGAIAEERSRAGMALKKRAATLRAAGVVG